MKCDNCGETISWLSCFINDENKRFCCRFCAEKYEAKLGRIKEKHRKERENERNRKSCLKGFIHLQVKRFNLVQFGYKGQKTTANRKLFLWVKAEFWKKEKVCFT